MTTSHLAISARGLSKAYTIAHNQREAHATLAEAALARLRRPFGQVEREVFWALKDVNFDIKKGDVVGIIGRNGAGKSTLLKVLSRITEPTTGEIDVYGRIGSLLEVGTGFHPELSGRENIFLNGAILGMTKAEIRKQFEAIVDFAGVARFLDTPVKRYSSGMYVRLAFAVAAHLRSEILVVDEVLAVGDAEFQRKCLGKMKDVATDGRTVLFVSHHIQSVQVLCNSALYLERGTCIYHGAVGAAIERYLAAQQRAAVEPLPKDRRPGTGELRVSFVRPSKYEFSCGEEKRFHYRIEQCRPYAGRIFLGFRVRDELGATLLQCDSRMVGHWVDCSPTIEGEMVFRTPWLKPGDYTVDLFVCSAGIIDAAETACHLRVAPLLPYPVAGNDEATSLGVVLADFSFQSTDSAPRCRSTNALMPV